MLHPVWLTSVDEDGGGDEYSLRWYGLGVICLALFIGQIDITIVNLALPAIGRDLGASASELQWVMDAYSVTLAGFVLLGGGLADRYGRKGAFMSGMALFGLASCGAVLATEPWQLITARSVMGLGAALFFPPALSILAVIFRRRERGRAVSIWAAAGGIATVLGPVIGGFLLGSFWWGSVFLVNVPVALAALIGAAVLLPTSTRPGAPPLDVMGAMSSVLGLAGLVFGLIEGPGRGWLSPVVVGAIAVGAASIVAFVVWERRVEAPMVDVRVFRRGGVSGGGLSITMNLLAMTGMLFLLPQYLEYISGESTVAIGVYLIPFGLTFMVLALVSGRVARAIGVGPVLTGGLVVMAAGMVILAFVPDLPTVPAVLVGTMVFGAGAAFVAPPGTTAVMNALPTALAGDGSAVNQITRQVGAALGVAVVGTVLASVYVGQLGPAVARLSPADTAMAESSIAGAEQVAVATGSNDLTTAAEAAFSEGYRRGMLAPVILVLLAAVFVAITMRPRDAGRDP